jgi:type II secretory pathway component PulM
MSPAFLLLGVVLSWFFIWQPLAEAMRTGHLHYYLQGILLGPIFFYLGIVGLFTDISDAQIRQPNARGQRKLTAKGRKMVLGSVAVVAVTAVGWFWLLNVLGFQI